MSFDINAQCMNNEWVRIDGPNQVMSSVDSPAKTVTTTDGVQEKRYQIVWEVFSRTTFQAFYAWLLTVKYSRAFEWQPPDEASAAPYRFETFAIEVRSAVSWAVTATLRYRAGVTVA
jgi:hypothetical protein